MPVAALGNALNLGQTFTNGVISASKRRLKNPMDGSSFVVLQHNAAVNPGNSGGALVDKRGNLVGINNAMLSNASAIGFSISIDSITDYLNKFFKKIKGAWFGIYDLKPLSHEDVEAMHELGFTYRGGLLVSKVSSATPVKEAGLEKNDVIVSINDIAVEMVEDLRLREAVIDPKLPVEMLVWRAKKFVKLIVRPVPKPKSFGMSTVLLSGNHFLSGLQILELTPEVSEKLKLPSDTKGLVVLNGFDPQLDMGFSFSRRAALIEKGDLLLKMNGKVLSKPDDLKEVLEKKTPDDFFDLLLVRNGRQIQLTFNSKQESIMNNNKIKNNLNMQKEDSHPFISDQQGQDDFLNQFQKQVEGMLMGMRNPNTIISADSEMATNA